MTSRPIRSEEAELICYLLDRVPEGKTKFQVPVDVADLDDGGMGSLRLNLNPEARYGADLGEVMYKDSDNVEVLITLTIDQDDRLFELDMWKVNFDKLIEFPTPEKIERTK
jgi:hypothetical protein